MIEKKRGLEWKHTNERGAFWINSSKMRAFDCFWSLSNRVDEKTWDCKCEPVDTLREDENISWTGNFSVDLSSSACWLLPSISTSLVQEACKRDVPWSIALWNSVRSSKEIRFSINTWLFRLPKVGRVRTWETTRSAHWKRQMYESRQHSDRIDFQEESWTFFVLNWTVFLLCCVSNRPKQQQ